MYFEQVLGNEVAKLEMELAERRAARNWRFRDVKSKESKVLTSLLTAVLGLFVR